MSLGTLAPYDKLVALLATVQGMQQVYEGVPESVSTAVSCYVTLGGGDIRQNTTSMLQRELSFLVTFVYRVARAEAAVERALMAAVDDFLTKFFADRTLADTWEGPISVDLSLAGLAEYQTLAGQEFRRYPIVLRGAQRQNV